MTELATPEFPPNATELRRRWSPIRIREGPPSGRNMGGTAGAQLSSLRDGGFFVLIEIRTMR